MKKFSILSLATLLLISCGEKPVTVEPLKTGDKKLSCNEILLEINEAKFYREQAEEKQAVGISTVVMPIGYIDTYMNANEAIAAANSRVRYLSGIYEVRNCATNNTQVISDNSQNYMVR